MCFVLYLLVFTAISHVNALSADQIESERVIAIGIGIPIAETLSRGLLLIASTLHSTPAIQPSSHL